MDSGLYIKQTRETHKLKFILLGVIAVLVGTSSYFAFNWYTKGDLPPVPLPASAMADTSVDESEVTPAQVESYTVAASQPRYISIPALNINKARVQQVGLTALNTLDTPKNISDTAWFKKSTTPGTGSGAVVIDGHNGGVSRKGVFAKLDTLKAGDEISIERGDGEVIKYLVQDNRTMSLADANNIGMQQMMKSVDQTKEGLSLITCAGNWVPRDKVFDKRIMVRATAE